MRQQVGPHGRAVVERDVLAVTACFASIPDAIRLNLLAAILCPSGNFIRLKLWGCCVKQERREACVTALQTLLLLSC